jgi:predicted nucleic acid-binding protein
VSYLLDTNVISEAAKPAPDAGVMSWLAAIDEDELFLSVVSLAEIRHGIERMQKGRRRDALEDWLTNDLPNRFDGRLIDVDKDVANQWGLIVGRAQATGRPIGAMDAFLAATAVQHGLVLATRNQSDFEASGIQLFNPWTDA